MARKLPRLQRVLDAPALASVAYGEVASSLYFALGIVALTAVEVPLDLPLDAELPDDVREANEQLDEARAIGDSYGVTVIGRIARTRNIGRAIVDEAIRRNSEIIVMAGPRRVRLQRGRRQIFGDAVDFVLRHAPCRVMVATPRERAA